MEEDELDRLLEDAQLYGVLGPTPSGVYEPDPARMRALAAGDVARGPSDALVHAWLAAGPLPEEVVVRALARHRADKRSHDYLQSMWHREPFVRTLELARDQLAEVPGLRRVKVGGVAWIARPSPSPALPARVEGFVTPNLEVIVGPDPDPRIVARVALAAELVRIDRVLTFRLRPKSVARAVLAGLHGEELTDALSRIGRHGLPDAVRAQVLDWSAAARVARAEPVTALSYPPRLHDEVTSALGELAFAAPAPGFVPVPAGRSLPDIQARLSPLGIEVSGSVVAAPLPPEPLLREAPDLVPPPLPLDASRCDAVLRRRFDEERAAGFAPSLSGLHAEPDVPFESIDWERLRAVAAEAPPATRKALHAIIRLHERRGEEVIEWLARHRGERADVDPMSLLCLQMIGKGHRKRLLASAAPVRDVLREARALVELGHLSPAGKNALAAISAVPEDDLLVHLAGIVAEPAGRPPPPPMTRGEILAGLRDSCGLDLPVAIAWEGPNGTHTAHVWIDELRTRGREPVVLVTEVETERCRVLPLYDVRWIERLS